MDDLYKRFNRILTTLNTFESKPHIAVGVSGGPDSMALTFLLHQWIQEQGGHLHALTVDHGLRPESQEEAFYVDKILKNHGIFHSTLSQAGFNPLHRIQEKARTLRYNLLETYCWKKGIFQLFMAHHQEDQAETFLLRLGKKSGLSGLCGMRFVENRWFGQIIRPLLSISKKELLLYLKSKNISFILDPSNENSRFERVYIRKHTTFLESINLTSDVIAHVTQKLQKAEESLDKEVIDTCLKSLSFSSFGFFKLDLSSFLNFPEEMQQRVLEKILQTISGRSLPLRSSSLGKILNTITTKKKGVRATLSQCFIRSRKDTLFIVREENSFPILPISQIKKNLWGKLFYIERKNSSLKEKHMSSLEIRPLGKKGVFFLQQHQKFLSQDPSYVAYALPSLWHQKKLLSVPHLGFCEEKWKEAGLDVPVCTPLIPLSGKIFFPVNYSLNVT